MENCENMPTHSLMHHLPFILHNSQLSLRLPLIILLVFLLSSCSTGSQKELDLQLRQASLLSRQGDIYGAIESYKKALELDPASAKIHVEIARLERRIGQFDLAIKHLEKAVQLDPGLMDARIDLGYCYLVSHRYKDAKAMADVVLKSNPGNVQARLLLNDRDALRGDYEKALGQIEKLLHDSPKDFLLLIRKGDLNLLLGRKEEAKRSYRAALEIAPSSDVALLGWANFCGVIGDPDGRESALKELCDRRPENLLYISLLGDFYLEQGRKDEATALYVGALDLPHARQNFSFLARAAEVFL